MAGSRGEARSEAVYVASGGRQSEQAQRRSKSSFGTGLLTIPARLSIASGGLLVRQSAATEFREHRLSTIMLPSFVIVAAQPDFGAEFVANLSIALAAAAEGMDLADTAYLFRPVSNAPSNCGACSVTLELVRRNFLTWIGDLRAQMLAAREDCLPLLRSPRTLKRLAFDSGGDASTEDARTRFKSIDGTPVLIDFGNSVLDEQELRAGAGASSIERRGYDGAIRLAKRLLSPPKAATRNNIKLLIDSLEEKSARVLVVGGGTIGQGMEQLYQHPSIKVLAFDIYRSERTQFLADAHAIPMADNSVDAVVIQAVLEHVVQPDLVVNEIWRVLRPNGLVYAETPFMQQVHEGAYDFTRFTESGHRYLFRRFAVVKSGTTAGPGTQLLWSIDYFARSLFRSRIAGKIAKAALFWLQSLDRLMPESYASDGASGVFFLGKRSDVELSARDIIDFYRGAQHGGKPKVSDAGRQGSRASAASSVPPNSPIRA